MSTTPSTNGASDPQLDPRQLLKMLLELGPLVVFFITNSYYGIFWGTGVFMVATVISLTVSRVLFGRIPTMPLVSGLFIMVFGGLTLWLQDDLFIKMKPTIVNGLFAAILFGGLLSGRPLLKHLFGDVFHLQNKGWLVLTFRWACFFLFLAAINEVIWRNFNTDFWVSFKVFAIMPLTMAFAIAQLGVLKRYECKPEPQA